MLCLLRRRRGRSDRLAVHIAVDRQDHVSQRSLHDRRLLAVRERRLRHREVVEVVYAEEAKDETRWVRGCLTWEVDARVRV